MTNCIVCGELKANLLDDSNLVSSRFAYIFQYYNLNLDVNLTWRLLQLLLQHVNSNIDPSYKPIINKLASCHPLLTWHLIKTKQGF